MIIPPAIARAVREAREHHGKSDTSAWLDVSDKLVEMCHSRQRDFVLDPGRRIVGLIGRGGGKSTAGLVRLVRRLFTTPGARCVFIATTRQHAEELIWERLKDICQKCGVIGRFQETKLKLTLPKNNAQLRLVGCDDKKEIGKLRGLAFHEVGIDEGSVHKPQLLDHLIYRIIGPRLGDYDGCLWVIGTPEHMKGPFYDATRNGSEISRPYKDRDRPEYEGWSKWSLHKWSLAEAAEEVPVIARLWAEAQVEKEANGWSDDHPVWRREYLGEWAADDTERVYRYRPHDEDGAPLNQWTPPLRPGWTEPGHMLADVRGDEWSYVYGMDFGWADAFAIGVYAFKGTEKRLYHMGEVIAKEMHPRKVAELLLGEGLDADNPGGLIGRTGWPVAMVADKSAGGAAIMKELQAVYGLVIDSAEKKDKHDVIELTNGDFIDGRIVILKDSITEEQLLSNEWDVDDYGKLRERRDQPNDATDALIYARRRAMHLLADDRPPQAPPPRGSTEARQKELDEEERALIEGRSGNDFSDWLGDDYGMDAW